MLVKLSNVLEVNLFRLYLDTEENVNDSENKTKISLNLQVELTPEEWKKMDHQRWWNRLFLTRRNEFNYRS